MVSDRRTWQAAIFDARFMPEVDAAIIKATKHKALPILYPMRDLKEQRILSISDVLSAYPAHLLAVSLRYDVVSTLAGKLSKKTNAGQLNGLYILITKLHSGTALWIDRCHYFTWVSRCL